MERLRRVVLVRVARASGAVAATAVAVYAVVLAYTKLAGLRSFSKLSSFDFVVTVAIGSIVSSVVILEDVSLVRGAVALAVLFAIQEILGRLRLRYEFVARSVGNVPILLMDGPRVLHENLKKVRVSEDEVRAQLRAAGVLSVASRAGRRDGDDRRTVGPLRRPRAGRRGLWRTSTAARRRGGEDSPEERSDDARADG